MLVWLASYPRSGNTMCRRLLVGLYGLLTYAIYEYPVLVEPREGYIELSNLSGLPDFFKFAPQSEILRWMHEDDAIYVVKTHEMPPNDTYPAIYIARDGRDALVSYARFTLSYDRRNEAYDQTTLESTLQSLILDHETFGGWSGNVLGWMQRPNTALVRFDDLLAEPEHALRAAFNSLGISPPEPVAARDTMSFEQLHERSPHLYEFGRSGTWQSLMPLDLQGLFWEQHGDAMTALGYERPFTCATVVGPRERVALAGRPPAIPNPPIVDAIEPDLDQIESLLALSILINRKLRGLLDSDGGSDIFKLLATERQAEIERLTEQLRLQSQRSNEKEAIVEQLRASLAERQRLLMESDTVHGELLAQLKAKDREIDAKDEALLELNASSAEARLHAAVDMRETEGQLRELLAEIEAKDLALHTLDEAAAELTRQLKAKDEALQEKERALADLHRVAQEGRAEYERTIADLRAQVEALKAGDTPQVRNSA